MVRIQHVLAVVLAASIVVLVGCSRSDGLKPIVLPPTPVLSVRAHWGVAQEAYLRVFADPSTGSRLEFILRSGDIVEISAKSGYTDDVRGVRDYWYHVISDSRNGWVFGNGLDLYESRERAENASRLLSNG